MSLRCFTSASSAFPPYMQDVDFSSASTSRPTSTSASIRPELLGRNASSNASLRELLAYSGAETRLPPPGCQAVMSSGWSRFSSRSSSKSSEYMKASVLWAPRGTTPDYSPPVAEWFDYMGIDKTDPVACGAPTRDQTRTQEPGETKLGTGNRLQARGNRTTQ
jgi:hypothetical protein